MMKLFQGNDKVLYFISLPIFLALLTARVTADQTEIPITSMTLWSQADPKVQYCVTTWISTYTSSFGCNELAPASCLCLNASRSYSIAKSISYCITEVGDAASQVTNATRILADYCSTNAGVSAHDETLIQDIPLYTEFKGADCATDMTSSFSTSNGCDFVTPASCLCSNTRSSYTLASSMISCMGERGFPSSEWSSVTILFGSYCSINLQNPATRTVAEGPASNSATTTTTGSGLGPTATNNSPPSNTPAASTFPSQTASAGSSSLDQGQTLAIALPVALGIPPIIITFLAWWYPDARKKVREFFSSKIKGFRLRSPVYRRSRDNSGNNPLGDGENSGELRQGRNTSQPQELGVAMQEV